MTKEEEQQYKEAFDAKIDGEMKVYEHNKRFFDEIGPTAWDDFCEITENCSMIWEAEYVDRPEGDSQDEHYSILKNIHVDQYSVGDSGDSFNGSIYAQVPNGKWIRIPFEWH